MIGSKKGEKKKLDWQRRIEEGVQRWRKDLSGVEKTKNGARMSERIRGELYKRHKRSYHIKR